MDDTLLSEATPLSNELGNETPSLDYSGFRHPVTNARYTKILFWENQQESVESRIFMPPRYTLHRDIPGLVNFRREYVRLGDPSGYKLSQLYLEDFAHFQLLMKAPWFKNAKAEWDAELDAKLLSEGMTTIRSLSKDDDTPKAIKLAAAKFLTTRTQKTKTVRGRPSTEEVQGELRRVASEDKDILDDISRIRSVK